MNQFFFDHTYTFDHQHRMLRKLERFGFRRMESTVEHPGGAICRFLGFPSGLKGKMNYLEFIHVKPGGAKIRVPGISFGSKGNLEKFHRKMLRTRVLQTEFEHKNYSWKSNSKDRLPGWNFVSFKNLGFRSLYPWLTEYEARSNKTRPTRAKSHPNGVTSIHALVLQLNSNGAKFMRALLGREPKARVKLPCGTWLYFSRGKTTKLKSAVLHTKDFKKFLRKFGCDEFTDFEGQSAARIRNVHSEMWDILIV